MKIKSFCILLFIAIVSCKQKKKFDTIPALVLSHPDNSISKDSRLGNDKSLIIDSIAKISQDSLKFDKLPLGSLSVKFDFEENISTVDENGVKIVNDTTIKINNLLKKTYDLMEVSPKQIISSIDGINAPYERKSIFLDRNSKNYERIYLLPIIHEFNAYVERVSKKENYNNSTEVQYCLAIYKNGALVNRTNIGYVYYGDLVESYKVWYIDEDYTVYNRIIAIVSGNSETHVGPLRAFKITTKGELVRYFDAINGSFTNKTEIGKIKNHVKDGFWIEKKYNPYNDQYTYIEATYKEGIPVGKWNYYNLIEGIEKGVELLMTEEYSEEGELKQRKIINQK